jgi:hypothetical protein
MTDYDFLPQIPIDEGHTLDQLTGRFQSVKDGLPELPKNSKDQYLRLGVDDRNLRQIVVIANSALRSLAVLDFAGASIEDFDGWQTWSSRTANRSERSGDIEGGHGNGGKAFMVRGSTADSYIESCYQGLRTKMGFKNDEPERLYLPAYARENGRRICGVREPDVLERLQANLAALELDYEQLPRLARDAFKIRDAFTFLRVSGVRDWTGRRPSTVRNLLRQVPQDLSEHAQVALTLETCSVWVVADGVVVIAEPLRPEYPEPFPGFENLNPILLPDVLPDPETGDPVRTGTGERKFLQLRTSREPLRRSDRRKAMNVIRVQDLRNIVGNWSVADLAPRPESAFIYGAVHVPALTAEHQAGAERRDLADVPLVRAVKAWVADCTDELAGRIQQSQARNHRPEDRNKANEALDRLRELMRQFLEPETPGHPEREYGTTINEVVFEGNKPSIALALGTKVPLQINCYEVTAADKRLPVRNPDVELIASEPGVVELADGGVLRGMKAGKVRAKLKAAQGGAESNEVEVEVVTCVGVDILCPDRPLLQGEHVRLTTIFRTEAGSRDDLLIEGRTRNDLLMEGMVDETDMGRLSRNGWFTAGHLEGLATIRIRYGPNQQDTNTATITIGSDVAPIRRRPEGRDGSRGDIPLILLCGETAPHMEELPPDQRTHQGGPFHPTIIEEPPFDHVVWINPNSKEATRVRQERPGAVGVDRIASKAFLQFISLKCFDILKRLKVRQEVRDTQMTEVEFRDRMAQAEMECAPFIDAAFDLADDLYHSDAETLNA